jgi:hypothetical protein
VRLAIFKRLGHPTGRQDCKLRPQPNYDYTVLRSDASDAEVDGFLLAMCHDLGGRSEAVRYQETDAGADAHLGA